MSGFKQLRFLIGASLAIVIWASTDADAQTTALRGARVIDGSGGAAIDNAVIVSATAASSPSVRPPEPRFPAMRRSSTITAKPSFRASSRITHT